MSPKAEIVAEWLQKARNDLETARRALQPEPVTDTACFHCQQAVEKALKACLQNREALPPRTHDLPRLLDLVVQFDSGFEKLREVAESLNEYSVEVRYVSSRAILIDEAQAAFSAALAAVEAIRERLGRDSPDSQAAAEVDPAGGTGGVEGEGKDEEAK